MLSVVSAEQVSRYSLRPALLKLEYFKVPEHTLPKEIKARIKQVVSQHKKVDDTFLQLFEKRNIIFLEDGTDLKNELGKLMPNDKKPSHL